MWIIDHTIQIGEKKLFVIVGCPLPAVPFGQRCLSLADLHLVALVPMEQSNQDLIDAELEKATLRTGALREILSDHAGDLTKGIELYQQRHAATAAVGDVAHYGANVLENRWERDPRWAEMVKRFSAVNQQIRQTADAFLLSPTLRNKARFMSVGPLLRFARRVLALLKRASPNARAQLRYGWLLEYEEDLARWLVQYDLVDKTIKHVRLHGVNSTTLENLEKEWGPESADPGNEDGPGASAGVREEGCAPTPGRRNAGWQQRDPGIGVREIEGESRGKRQGRTDRDRHGAGNHPGQTRRGSRARRLGARAAEESRRDDLPSLGIDGPLAPPSTVWRG